MRLTCPNCEAQYEVPDEVIPETGRDVQCSSCGDTWFQYHPDHIPAHEPDDLEADEPDNPANWQDLPDEPSEAEDAADDSDLASRDDDAASDPEPAPAPRELDPEVRDILHEEARRETAARAAERGGLETQTELGLAAPAEDESARRSREAQARVARLRGETASAETETEIEASHSIDPTSRRDLLPDIEEISSSLRSEDGRDGNGQPDADYPDAASVPSGSGFRRGFLLVVVLAALAALVYAYAPALEAAVPALAGPLDAFVTQVDQARLWLDGQVRALMLWLDGQASTAS
ncbi:zinc-ribbon domain-containing protein [Roseovarius sp. SCSIO 43702]|uniref:zinc-ribbon domain-containing protein n=1 Tax=Roseovarius sp. SCSIO 43702 TaxID=2823043 RepID=UPI001C734BCC|nr:zinc-ribbon domain-containing protein [Roseovarius sp. SCSIO 43702]QYX56688.1 zinc-ribbon domain-containing protein [Roseovarius sp. SCSIO 43702]